MAIISMNRWGEVKFLDNNNNEITDYYEIQDIKRNTNWKEIVYNQSVDLINDVEKNISAERNFYLKTEKLLDEEIQKINIEKLSDEDISEKITKLNLQQYQIPEYPELSDEECTKNLIERLEKFKENPEPIIKDISVPFFPPWTYVKRFEEALFVACSKQIAAEEKQKKDEYYDNQKKIKTEKEKNELKERIEEFLFKNDEEIISSIKSLFDEKNCCFINVNKDCFIILNFLNFSKNCCTIQLNLPDISEIENRSAKMLASGKVSVKRRSPDEITSDWHFCCCGAILYAASKIFNVNMNIKSVEIQSYYTVINEATGQNEYYDFENTFFTRDDFKNLNIQSLNPTKTIQYFHKDLQQQNDDDDFENENQISNQEENEITIIDSGNPYVDQESVLNFSDNLKKIGNEFGDEIFLRENAKKFSAVCRDIFPNEDEKITFLEKLSENGLLEELEKKDLKSDFFIRLITAEGPVIDKNLLLLFTASAQVVFNLSLVDLLDKTLEAIQND